MRNGYFGWLSIGLLGAAAFAACITPSGERDPEEDGAGASGGETTGTAGSGMGGSDPGGCEEITSLTEIRNLGVRVWETVIEPGFSTSAPDYVELYIPVEQTTFSLPASLYDCDETQICAIGYEDYTDESNGAYFAADSGTLTVESITDTFYVSGSVSDVTLVEITINDELGVTAVPNGRCLHIASAAFALEEPTPGWVCDPGYYDETGAGLEGPLCDCECGAVDPDCANAANEIDGCEEGQTCGATSAECEGTPTAWTCAADQYDGGAGNGCDCNCGTADPDCEIMTEAVEGCPANSQCPVGECLPAAWTCNPTYYDSGLTEDCDCGCGAVDPDCTDQNVGSCDYCDLIGSCNTAACPGTINPTNNGICQ